MSQIVQDTGAKAFLDARLNNTFPTSKDLTLFLFCNNITPADTDTFATYTEATGGGYAAKTLTCGSWTTSITSSIAQAVYAQQVFTFTGTLTTNGTIYGYGVKDSAGNMITAELLDTPCTPVANGNHVDITPLIKASKGTPA